MEMIMKNCYHCYGYTPSIKFMAEVVSAIDKKWDDGGD